MSRSNGAAVVLRWTLAAGFAALSIYATVQLGRGMTPTLSWAGLLVAAGAPLTGILAHRDFETRPPLIFTACSGLGLAITMVMSHRFGPAAGQIHVWAGVALISWFAWVRWLRRGFAGT